MPLEALYPTISEQIVTPMAVAEAQGVILYFFSKNGTGLLYDFKLNNYIPRFLDKQLSLVGCL